MPFQKDNKEAETWTEETAIEFIEDVDQYIEENKLNYHLGLACVKCNGYPELWSYLGNKFEKSDNVFKAIKKVEIILEARIVNSTMTGELKSAAMAIFYLKNKHGYKDKTETEINANVKTTQQEIRVNTPEEKKQIDEWLNTV